MCDPRVMQLVSEIRDLYMQQCALSDRLGAAQEREARSFADRCKPRPNARYPELERFTSVFDCQDALMRAQKDRAVARITRIMQTITWLAVMCTCLPILLYTNDTMLATIAAVAVGGCLLLVQHSVLIRPGVQRSLREQLRERGVPICVMCGYDLRTQSEGRCPECGTLSAPPVCNPLLGGAAAHRPPQALPR